MRLLSPVSGVTWKMSASTILSPLQENCLLTRTILVVVSDARESLVLAPGASRVASHDTDL